MTTRPCDPWAEPDDEIEDEPPPSLAVLWVTDPPTKHLAIMISLVSTGHRLTFAGSNAEAIAICDLEPPDVVVTTIARPEGEDAGLSLIDSLRVRGDAPPVALLATAEQRARHAERIERSGALVATTSRRELIVALNAVEPRSPPDAD